MYAVTQVCSGNRIFKYTVYMYKSTILFPAFLRAESIIINMILINLVGQ